MVFDLSEVAGLGPFTTKKETDRTLYFKSSHAFLVVNKSTIEVRCDTKLAEHLQAEYESVMQSRYFGRGGIEIVPTTQLNKSELDDLVRLSYNLTD